MVTGEGLEPFRRQPFQGCLPHMSPGPMSLAGATGLEPGLLRDGQAFSRPNYAPAYYLV